MAADTIDYIVSFVLFLGIMTAMIVTTTNNLNNVYTYQKSQQISVVATNLMNGIVQNTGYPLDWGQSSVMPSSFGLKWPDGQSLMISPFAPLRLIQSSTSVNFQGAAYSELSLDNSSLFMKASDHLSYTNVSRLMNVNGQYGWRITYSPLLSVEVSPQTYVSGADFKVNAKVMSKIGPLSQANVNATLIYCSGGYPYPQYTQLPTATAISNSSGVATLEFPNFTPTVSYIVLVRATFSGLSGSGLHVEPPVSTSQPLSVLVTNYEDGIVTIAHTKDIQSYPFSDPIYYNATFIQPIGVLNYQCVSLSAPVGVVSPGNPESLNLGESKNNPGIILLLYRTSQGVYGLTFVPWGITPLSLEVTFGDNPQSASTIIVKTATVNINRFSYRLKIELWNLET